MASLTYSLWTKKNYWIHCSQHVSPYCQQFINCSIYCTSNTMANNWSQQCVRGDCRLAMFSIMRQTKYKLLMMLQRFFIYNKNIISTRFSKRTSKNLPFSILSWEHVELFNDCLEALLTWSDPLSTFHCILIS